MSTASWAAWKKANPEKNRKINQRWREENLERIRELNRKGSRKWRSVNREKNIAGLRSAALRRNYGITELQYDEMLALNGSNCWLCDKPRKEGGKRLAVDHDHATGRVRGLVHWHCNSWYIGKNTLESARRLVSYLENNFDGRDI